LARVWSASVIGLTVVQEQSGTFRSLPVFGSGCPVDDCLPLVLVLVTGSGRGGFVMVAGNPLVGLCCRAEGMDAGGDRLLCGSLRGGQVTLRGHKPLAACDWGPIVTGPRLQLVNPRADGVNAPHDFLIAALAPGLWLVVHAVSVPAADGFATWAFGDLSAVRPPPPCRRRG
jgi:hypothetical protein